MNREEKKAERRRLHKIYLEHDVPGFREFIKDRAESFPTLIPFVGETEKVLSDLMYNMKSQLMYLGPQWQEARNVMRFQQFWEKDGKALLPLEDVPLCNNCQHFRTSPHKKEPPCMQMGATPADLACNAFVPLK